jgi:O-antigen ligase
MYLQYLLELGFIGLGFFIWILFLIARIFWTQDLKWRPIFLGLLATFLVAGITESWHNDKEITMIFWVMVGCAEVLRRHEKA